MSAFGGKADISQTVADLQQSELFDRTGSVGSCRKPCWRRRFSTSAGGDLKMVPGEILKRALGGALFFNCRAALGCWGMGRTKKAKEGAGGALFIYARTARGVGGWGWPIRPPKTTTASNKFN